MYTPASPPSGTPLWAHLSLDDVKDLIRDDVADLKRLHALKFDNDQLPPEQRNILLTGEIAALEAAHDSHWKWYREIAARETGKPSEKALG